MSIKTVMFDFDGTLVNTNDLIVKCFQHTFRTYTGKEMDRAEIQRNFGEPLGVTMERCFGKDRKRGAMDVYRSLHRGRFVKLIRMFPGMDELVKELKQKGYQTALVTSRLAETAMLGIETFGLKPWFDTIVTMDRITRHKPDPQAIQLALSDLGAKAAEAVMIGDTKYDMLCAKNAGCLSILVDWSVMEGEERERLAPDYIAKSPEQIREIIENI